MRYREWNKKSMIVFSNVFTAVLFLIGAGIIGFGIVFLISWLFSMVEGEE